MENKKVVPTWVSMILLVLCAVNLAGVGIMVVTSNRIQNIINSSLSFCAVILALIYCFMGYKKNAAKFFRFFSIALIVLVLLQINHYAVSACEELVKAVGTQPDANSTLPGLSDAFKISIKITIPVLLLAMLFTLTVAKDLGKKKSYCLASLSFALSTVNLISALVNVAERMKVSSLPFGNINAGISIESSVFILCAIYGIMVYAKYQDKTARGTK